MQVALYYGELKYNFFNILLDFSLESTLSRFKTKFIDSSVVQINDGKPCSINYANTAIDIA